MPRRHPLSLHDERGERRAKGRRKPFGAVFFSPWNLSSFDRTRFASAHKCAGAYRIDKTAWFPRRATPAGIAAVRARGAYVFYLVEAFPAALTLQFKYPGVAETTLTLPQA